MPIRSYLSGKKLDELVREIEPFKIGFDQLKFHTIITDSHGNILYANKAVETQTGYSVAESIGKNPADLWGGHMTREFYEKMWNTILKDRLPFVGEVKNTRKDGTPHWQELHISPILDKQGKPRFFIGIEPNITERKEKEQFQKEFLELLAHQLKSPLTAIKWSLDLILSNGHLTKEQKTTLLEVYKKNYYLIDLISDFLVITKIGVVDEKKETINLSEEVNEIVNQTKSEFPKVVIENKIQESFFITANGRSFVRQVFLNLINNAFKYADEYNPRVTLDMIENDGQILFTIENNGQSILHDEHKSVFTKLYRGSNATQRNLPGTGLGLYIVKLICDHFDWTVEFVSPDVNGLTVFTVKIPTNKSK